MFSQALGKTQGALVVFCATDDISPYHFIIKPLVEVAQFSQVVKSGVGIHLLLALQKKPISLINDFSGGNKIFIKLPDDSTIRFHFFNQQAAGQHCTFSPWSNLMDKRIHLLFRLVFPG